MNEIERDLMRIHKILDFIDNVDLEFEMEHGAFTDSIHAELQNLNQSVQDFAEHLLYLKFLYEREKKKNDEVEKSKEETRYRGI